MKKEVVIIAGSCYPISSASGSIALKCADYIHDVCNIRLISLQEGNNVANGMSYRNVSIYTLTQWRLRLAQLSEKGIINSSKLKSRFFKCANYILRIIGRIQSMLFTVDNCWWYKKKAYKQLEKLNKEQKIDIILSISAPIESHYAAKKFKERHPEVRWVTYWTDLFAAKINRRNIFINLDKMKKMEFDILKSSDYILATEEVFEIFNERANNYVANKISAIPYIFKQEVLNRDNYVPITNDEPIRCVYMGSFYRDIRNPEFMLKFFTALEKPYILDLYTTGNCADIVHKYATKSNGRITEHGLVSAEQLDDIMSKAHILINIENAVPTCIPSKLFELMSYRKPIINFKHKNQNYDVLHDYPCTLNINIGDDIESTINSFNRYFEEAQSFNQVSSQYILNHYNNHMESHVINIFRNIIYNL